MKSGSTKQGNAPLRVRVGQNYNARKTAQFGQSNAELITGPLTPFAGLNKRLDSFCFIGPGYDLIHTFNAVPILTKCPYVVTFEDFLPRTPNVYREIPGLEKYLVDRLLKPQCIAILAMSEFGLRQMQHQHRERPALAHLLAKSEVLYPGVQPTGSAPKSAGNELKLLFVGHDYYRKGGPALVRAHKKLRSAGIPVQTTIVSSFNWANTDYVGPPDADGVKAAESELSAEGISRHRSLSTDEVRCLMEQADFLILPTFHDTFGYVVLEAMAVATPVIATATCAQTEIIEPGRSGFLLEFDNDDIGQWSWFHGRKRYGYVEAYWSTIDRLASALAEQLQECWETRSDYEALSAGALARIDSKFNADRTRKRLEEIYEMARH